MEVWHAQVAQQNSAVGVRIGAHAPVALRRQLGQFRHESAILIEQLLGLVALHPTLKQLNMVRMFGIHQDRHLVSSERSFDLQAINHLRSRPALGRPQDDHWPAWPGGVILLPCIALDFTNALDGFFQCTGHQLVHLFRLIPFHKIRCPATAA